MEENNQPISGLQYYEALQKEKRKKILMYGAIALGVLAVGYFITKKNN